ncbi:MAG: GyrI-like domain-containing protein [Saprospiraceae bacterium]
MSPLTQLERFQRLTNFLATNFKTKITSQIVEEISFYSYRNINRIFLALQHETIGQHIKRLKLEKAAEYLKYSKLDILDIALELGYSDLAAFSKAFKKQFHVAPSHFRNTHQLKAELQQAVISTAPPMTNPNISFVLEDLPDLAILYLAYEGPYENLSAIENTWTQLTTYATQQNLIAPDTIHLAEILDDDTITETLHCRYHAAIVLSQELTSHLPPFFQTKIIPSQRYAKFIHRGSHASCEDTYQMIYAHWLTQVQLEFADAPTLEFYVNDESDTAVEDLMVEIYIPVKGVNLK